ncbi:hypothetical protein M2138_001537 [Dysgonomonadaceae bacterium PH5-43]|nr:hypothetical protein [Dysgonomonadaceae bacterium PH5-43]
MQKSNFYKLLKVMCKYIAILFIIMQVGCSAKYQHNKDIALKEFKTGELVREDLIFNRELLKDYFLCVCITYGFKEKNIEELDSSQAVYFDISSYAPEAFKEVKDYAIEFVENIKASPHDDLGNTKAIIMNCIDKYKSEEINSFIKSMDKYIAEDN